jgi:outer membrane assembly lipoprotein YfiO
MARSAHRLLRAADSLQSRHMRIVLSALLLCALSIPVMALEPKTSELHAGHWVDVVNPTTEPAVDPALVRIEQMIQQGKSKEAMKASVIWLKRSKDSPLFDRGLYLMAEALYQYGDRFKSFFYLDELLDTYPESPLFSQALEKQYQIADDFLNGYKRRFLKIRLLSGEEEAVEMLYRIQTRSPGSPLAEKALLRTADYYYADAQYDLAVDAYGAYIKNYPRSDQIPGVKLRQAYANLAQFRGLRFDTTPVTDAKAQLEDIVKEYPDLAAEENLPAVLQRIQSTYARKLEVIADFYKRTHEPSAAEYTYEYLEKTYPDTPEALEAQKPLARLQATTKPAQQ